MDNCIDLMIFLYDSTLQANETKFGQFQNNN